MACCLTAPNHYMIQCWSLISEALWHSPESNFTVSAQAIIQCNEFENYTFKITATSPRDQWVNVWDHRDPFHKGCMSLYWNHLEIVFAIIFAVMKWSPEWSSERLWLVYFFINSLRPRQNGRHFADDTFKRAFLNENVLISIKISLKFVSKGPINNIPALVQIMAWRRPGDKPLSEPRMVSLPAHICVTRPQWVNSLWIDTKPLHLPMMRT